MKTQTRPNIKDVEYTKNEIMHNMKYHQTVDKRYIPSKVFTSLLTHGILIKVSRKKYRINPEFIRQIDYLGITKKQLNTWLALDDDRLIDTMREFIEKIRLYNFYIYRMEIN